MGIRQSTGKNKKSKRRAAAVTVAREQAVRKSSRGRRRVRRTR